MTATAADLPVELLSFIVGYVGTNDRGRFYQDNVNAKDRRDLKSSSLVCLHWANWCRRRLFTGRPLRVRSLAELVTLETFQMRGSLRLYSIHMLVGRVIFEQNWEAASWCHRAYNSPILALTPELVLRGPIPVHLPRAAHRSPNWSLPRSLPSCYLPFDRVALVGVHIPDLQSLGALLRHFSLLPSVRFENVAWGDDALPALPRPAKRCAELDGASAEGCTEDALPCILALGRLGPSVFSYMGRRDVTACIELLRAISGVDDDGRRHAVCRRYTIGCGRECAATPCSAVSQLIIYIYIRNSTVLEDEYSGLIDEVPGITVDRSHSVRSSVSFDDSGLLIFLDLHCEAEVLPDGALAALRVVGLVLEFRSGSSRPHPRDKQLQLVPRVISFLHSALPSFVHLRVVELRAPLVLLRHAVRVSAEVSRLPGLGGESLYRWACPRKDFESARSAGCESVGVDPVTLEPTGACVYLLMCGVFDETDRRAGHCWGYPM